MSRDGPSPCVCGVSWDARVETPQDVEQALEEIDAVIDRLHAQRAGLRRRRNSLLPVSRLPAEVLAHIILLASLRPFQKMTLLMSAFASPQVPDYHAVAGFSHVSSVFRRVALGAATLWSAPPFQRISNADAMKDILCRSLNAPLSLVLDNASMTHRESIATRLLSIRHLYLGGPASWTNYLAWMGLLDASDSALEVLFGVWPRHIVNGPGPLGAPRLSFLCLFVQRLRVDLPPEIPLMTSLRRLSLCTERLRPADLMKIIQLLAQAPSLEELEISDHEGSTDGHDEDWEHANGTSGVGLPAPILPLLCRVRLNTGFVGSTSILRNIQVPPHASVEFVHVSPKLVLEEISLNALKHYLLTLGHGPQQARISWHPDRDAHYELCLIGFADHRTVSFHTGKSNNLDEIIPHVNWGDLRCVEILPTSHGIMSLWMALAQIDNPRLQSIHMSYLTPTYCHLVRAFMRTDSERRGVFLPGLRSLSIANAAFTMNELEDLVTVLTARRVLGVGLEELVFERCLWPDKPVEHREGKADHESLTALRGCAHVVRIVREE
jgi:hypothetical protein